MSEFRTFKKAIQKQVAKLTKTYTTLFEVDLSKEALWETYLGSFPEGTNPIYLERTEHDCNCCKNFIRHIGAAVAIDTHNNLISVWDVEGLPAPYDTVAKALAEAVKSSPVLNVYRAFQAKLGTDSNVQLLESNQIKKWEHFYVELPSSYVASGNVSIEAVQARYRDPRNVFKRSMEELTLDAGETILELIQQQSLYKGDEYKKPIKAFIDSKKKYDSLPADQKETWLWANAIDNPAVRIRNQAIGVLLIDISEGTMDLTSALRKFHKDVVAPEKFMRNTSVHTPRQIAAAEKDVIEWGYGNSLARRYARESDVTINNILYADRDTKPKLSGGSVFDALKEEAVIVNPKQLTKLDEVTLAVFLKDILPSATSLSILMESRLEHNLVSMIAPQDRSAPSMLRWDNNFSWCYNGDISDSTLKKNVKNAGGNVEGVLRFSIQWNEDRENNNDFDAHCVEPSGFQIYYGKPRNTTTKGELDVDIRHPGDKVAVENITWPELSRMQEGKYVFKVHNFAHRGGRTGFTAEIEYNGEIYSYTYAQELRQDEVVIVAELNFSKATGITFLKSLDSSQNSKVIWGLNTNRFAKVSMCMASPNYWDGQEDGEAGNKHYFFMLQGCQNENSPRGFFNEFLNPKLRQHRKVFEALGSKMRVEPSEDQLSGLGFSTSQRNYVIAQVEGKFKRNIKITF